MRCRDLGTDPISLADFSRAAAVIGETLQPTPQLSWPLLNERAGVEIWVKHENHLPTGAFKVRGGLWFMHQLGSNSHAVPGVVAATRGNHGQSIAFAAGLAGLQAVIVVPHGNNPEKNRAMRALGAELVEAGDDFDAALAAAQKIGEERQLYAMPSFHPVLVEGVGTYAVEFFRGAPPLAAVYVPIGLGSGICGVVAARDALGLDTEVIGVVSSHADAYAQSLEQGSPVSTASADTLADGLAVRVPSPAALEYMRTGVARIVRVDDAAVLNAIGAYCVDTHQMAEGAGAAPLAALLQEAGRYREQRVGVVLSGGNVSRDVLARALQQLGESP